jgi:hypothetical protein
MAHNNKAKVLMFVAAIAAFIGLAMYTGKAYDEFSCIAATHTMSYGDTIDSIAWTYCDENHSNAVQYIMDSNDITSRQLTSLRMGTIIHIPATK